MAAKLVAEEGTLKGLVLSLEDGDQWVIGRDPDACQLLVEDPSVSRKHLICRSTPTGIQVENLSETNPIRVNEEEVKGTRLLKNGDAIRIGAGIFRFYAEDTAQLIKEPTHDEEANPVEKKGQEGGAPAPEMPAEPFIKAQERPMPQEPIMEPNPKDIEPKQPLIAAPAAPAILPPPSAKIALEERETEEGSFHEEPRHDSIYDEEPSEKHPIAQINFGLIDTGRWLLKVISGPNNGAEFSMQTGNSYVIGTDPNACDIVFHDTSVSRQHARVSVSQEDVLTIEDLKSRNGTLVDGQPLKGKQTLTPNVLVSLGTTSFMVFDREGEMQTIISPLMPSIVKELQKEEPKKTDGVESIPATPEVVVSKPEAHPTTTIGAFILIGILTGLFVIVGIGTSTLFRSAPVTLTQPIDPIKALDNALAPFPSVKNTYNASTGQLLLVGHVLSTTDKSQLLYSLQGLNFIKSLDDSGVIIDEYVWREINQVLEKNPDWKAINVMSTTPGHFVVSGYLKTRNQADRLNEYLNANFPYPDLLEKRIVVDQEVITSINAILQSKGLKTITPKLDNGEVILTGGVPTGKAEVMTSAIAEIKEILGVRNVRNLTTGLAPDQSVINISDKYEVTGISNVGGRMSVVINGRILMKGDTLDGMNVTSIEPHAVMLEKDNVKYRIDFTH